MLLRSLLIVSAALPLFLALHGNVNWDEFLFLAKVFEYERGELNAVLQTPYVHLFAWLTAVPGTAVDQIVVARIIYYVFLLVSAACLYRVSRRFVSHAGSLVVSVGFFTFSNVLVHGTSFRADGLALVGYSTCLLLLFQIRQSWRSGVLAGLAFGCSLLVTIKSVLLLLAIVPLLSIGPTQQPEDLGRRLRRLGAFAIAGLFTFAVLLLLHQASLSPSSSNPITRARAAGGFLATGFLPNAWALRQVLILNPALVVLLGGGIGYLVSRAVEGEARRHCLQLLCLVAPLTSIFFYRNSFPYFYVLVTPPALIVVGVAYDKIRVSFEASRHLVWLLPALLLTQGTTTLAIRWSDDLDNQRIILEAIHEMFPDPVTYIDAVSMVATYPKAGFFMSSWGMRKYLSGGRPIFRDVVREQNPAFLLANNTDLEVFDHVYASEPRPTGRDLGESPVSFLLPEDRRFLRAQFIHHWGPVYVPGATLQLTADSVVTWKTMVSGPYTLESVSPVLLDGRVVGPGASVRVQAGKHELLASGEDQTITLRWGDQLHHPVEPPPEPPIFAGF